MNAPLFSHLTSLLALLGLIGLNGLLVACEISLIKLRFSHFDPSFQQKLRERKSLAPFFSQGDVLIKAIRMSMLACIVGYGVLVVDWLFLVYADIASAATVPWYSLLGAFLVSLLGFYILGELVPRGLGMRYPVATLEIASIPLRVVSSLLKPVIVLTDWLSGQVLWLFRANTGESLESLDIEAQIQQLGSHQADRPQVVEKLLRNALLLRELVVSDVLLPRHQVRIFDVNHTVDENLHLARRCGHTRYPLCEGDLDQCIGLIHIKDLFRYPGDLRQVQMTQLKREILRLSPEESLEEALQKLLGNKMHMALVVNEFGGTEGILTLERILEQLVGEIQDEFDAEEANIRALPNQEYVISGLTPTHELEEAFGLRFENQEVSTFGGLITSELGRIPDKGETLQLHALEIVITQVDEKRVIKTRVRQLEQSGSSEA